MRPTSGMAQYHLDSSPRSHTTGQTPTASLCRLCSSSSCPVTAWAAPAGSRPERQSGWAPCAWCACFSLGPTARTIKTAPPCMRWSCPAGIALPRERCLHGGGQPTACSCLRALPLHCPCDLHFLCSTVPAASACCRRKLEARDKEQIPEWGYRDAIHAVLGTGTLLTLGMLSPPLSNCFFRLAPVVPRAVRPALQSPACLPLFVAMTVTSLPCLPACPSATHTS